MENKHLNIEDFYKILTNNLNESEKIEYENHLKNCKYCLNAIIEFNDTLFFYNKNMISEYIINLSIYKIISKITFINFLNNPSYSISKLEYRGSTTKEYLKINFDTEKAKIIVNYIPENNETILNLNIIKPLNLIRIINKEEKIIFFEKNVDKDIQNLHINNLPFKLYIDDKIYNFF
jgi:hypothetical protein